MDYLTMSGQTQQHGVDKDTVQQASERASISFPSLSFACWEGAGVHHNTALKSISTNTI